MSVVIVTGSSGLVGSEATKFYAEQGLDVLGIDNDMRGHFFGPEASTHSELQSLERDLGDRYTHEDIDIRDRTAINRIFSKYGNDIHLIVHAAAQPSHDWAAREPETDFSINAVGTLNLLEATRAFSKQAAFIFLSTNKVYGDRPNQLPFEEKETRWELDVNHQFYKGIDESFPIDQTLHSLFGASKVAADVLVQEYGRYFDMFTACFRGGCLTGPRHAGTRLHGFLSYLMKCAITGKPYTIFGYKGKQVRDNLHSLDLVHAFDSFFKAPRRGEVYNMGGGRFSHCSLLEAVTLCESISGNQMQVRLDENQRTGDHKWWISDVSKFKQHFPNWSLSYEIDEICREIYEMNADKWHNHS